jgi:glycosyltransferase involved in cell wall biosynthesis
MADLAVLTVPVSAASWLPSRRKAITIPVGSNLASPLSSQPEAVLPQSAERVVAVFGITGGVHASREARDIGQAIAVAHQTVPGLKLVAFGCGTAAAAEELRCSVSGTPVEVLGLLEAGVAQQRLAQSHALLFVRGEVTAGRTTAVAGVAVGLPIVGYCGPTSGDPIVQAGVSLVPRGRADLLGQALARVLSDSELWSALHRQNREAFERHFSWSSIAHRFLDALRD